MWEFFVCLFVVCFWLRVSTLYIQFKHMEQLASTLRQYKSHSSS